MGIPPQWMVCFMENPTEMDDDWGYPYFRKPPYKTCIIMYLRFHVSPAQDSGLLRSTQRKPPLRRLVEVETSSPRAMAALSVGVSWIQAAVFQAKNLDVVVSKSMKIIQEIVNHPQNYHQWVVYAINIYKPSKYAYCCFTHNV